MARRGLRYPLLVVSLLSVAGIGACGAHGTPTRVPGLAERGTTMTTVKPTRQDLANNLSLSGQVTMNPIFGITAPVSGQIRFVDVRPPTSTPTKPTLVATIWTNGKSRRVEVPAGSVFNTRLVDDRSTVTAGMPIVSAKRIGYGIVAEVAAGQAYRVSDAPADIRVQVTNGPGPFACTALGSIAALPAGTAPRQPTNPSPSTGPNLPGIAKVPVIGGTQGPDAGGAGTTSEATGMRVVCVPPASAKMINGASATVEVITARASNVLVLPVEAVAGQAGKGKVDVVGADRTRQTRDVELGLTDGKVIEIKSGLTGDETIAVPGPNLGPQAGGNGAPGKGVGPT